MFTTPVSLPVLPPSRPLRLTPTDVSQFVRLEQCERYLRFRLAERAGQEFMEEYGVVPQRITPLLSLSGSTFEPGVEADLGRRFATQIAKRLTGDALQTLMRHKSYKTTQGYINMKSQLEEAVAKLHVPDVLKMA
jgi:hypothetical protein